MRIRPAASTVHTSTSCHNRVSSPVPFIHSIFPHRISPHLRLYHYLLCPSRSLITPISRPFRFLPPLITCIHSDGVVRFLPPVYRRIGYDTSVGSYVEIMHNYMCGVLRTPYAHQPRKVIVRHVAKIFPDTAMRTVKAVL